MPVFRRGENCTTSGGPWPLLDSFGVGPGSVPVTSTAGPGSVTSSKRPGPTGQMGAVLIGTVVCGVILLLGYLNKRRCVGPTFDSSGRSGPDWFLRVNRDVCYSDIQQLWLGRDINLGAFPYVNGQLSETGQLVGGAVEFPVLTGLLMWLGGLGSANDGDFLAYSALLLAPFGLITAALLFALAGVRAWWFVLSPALVMYAFLSWDLLPVACTTAAWAVLAGIGPQWTWRRRAILAAVALGLGAAAKFYPLMFLAPLAATFLILPRPAKPGCRPAKPDWRSALVVSAAGVGTFVAANLPIAVAGFTGWWAAFRFQWSRPIDLTTNSIWFWATRPFSGSDNVPVQQGLALASTVSTAVGLGAALVLGWVHMRRRGLAQYPWLQVSAAMLSLYLLLNKVHSPQHILWLLPFFVLLRIRIGWILSYFCADLAMGIGFFRWQYHIITGAPYGILDGWAAQAVMVGVWGRAVLLLGLTVAFLNAGPAFVHRAVRS